MMRTQVTIGRMTQSGSSKTRFDRSFKPVKVPIHCEALYDNILSQCKQVVWSDDKEIDTHRFYLADGSGASIYAGGNFELTSPLENGKKEILPWTLQNYLRVSKVAFPSRARIYVVKGI